MTLEVERLSVGYVRDVPILKGIDLTAREGLVTAILGPNGAGKSTLLKTIYGFLRPLAGEILHFGTSIKAIKPERMLARGVAYLLQGQSVFPSMTVEENLDLGAWSMRGDRRRVVRAFEQVYARFPWMKEKRSTPAGLLSGGERRMVEIARVTMTGPRTLLLDEPSVGLMPKLVDTVYAEIAKMKHDNLTILMVDQNVKKAIEIADYVYVLKNGENSVDGPQQMFAERIEDIVKEWI